MTSAPYQWIQVRREGLFVEPANIFIDPARKVERAIISHGHADHARPGHDRVLATPETLAIMRTRLGNRAYDQGQALALGEVVDVDGVRIFLAPAGHVLGSAQVAVEYAGKRVVYSGDYKRKSDKTCADFEVVSCDVFITEATFGLPIFRHPPPSVEIAKIFHSLNVFPERCHVIGAYALGKAQRMIMELRCAGYDAPIYIHDSLQELCDLYVTFGIDLGDLRILTTHDSDVPIKDLAGAIVVVPPGALSEPWARRIPSPVVIMASGWMKVSSRTRQRGVELPLVISDHADWEELLMTCEATSAAEVWVTHGREDALIYALHQKGIRARPLSSIGSAEINL